MTSRRGPARWVTPEGARLVLVHLTHTGGLNPRRRDGGALDGWSLIVLTPNGTLAATHHLGATVPEAELAKALAAVNAVPELPTRPEGATQ